MSDNNVVDELKAAETEEELILLNKRWRNRRRMAWLCLCSMILMTIAIMWGVDTERLPLISDPISWAYFTFASIVGAYMGLSAWSAKK